jgi:hypothetical protein
MQQPLPVPRTVVEQMGENTTEGGGEASLIVGVTDPFAAGAVATGEVTRDDGPDATLALQGGRSTPARQPLDGRKRSHFPFTRQPNVAFSGSCSASTLAVTPKEER